MDKIIIIITTTTSIGENVRKGKLLFTVVEFHSTAASLEIGVENPQNAKVDLPYDPVLGILPKDLLFYPTYTSSAVFIATVFTTARK